MRDVKSIFGVFAALLPILYCGGLLYYFADFTGSAQEAARDGLGPTLLGLGSIGLLFCIPLLVKIVGLFAGPRSPPSGGGGGGPDAPPDDSGFDADAVVARYLSRQSSEAPRAFAAPPTRAVGGPANNTSFGRKTT